MPRLIVNPDTPDAWAIEVAGGEISLGRDAGNSYQLEHPTVSSSHCAITASGPNLKVRDLGSTGGTFIDGELVETGVLRPGQTLQLGEVVLRLEGGAEPGAAQPPMLESIAIPPPIPAMAKPGTACRAHPRALARFFCPQCQGAFCGFCVNTRTRDGRPQKVCRSCGAVCEPIEIPPAPEEPEVGFYESIPGALVYPFTGHGAMLMFAGTCFFFVMSYLPMLALLCTGYVFGYAKNIVASSSAGAEEPPDWQDFTDWKEDVVWPYIQFLALVLLTFAPAILLLLFRPEDDTVFWVLMLAALGLGAAIAPMGMLTLAMFDTITALNPIGLVWSILRIPGPYFVAALAFEAVIAVNILKPFVVAVLIPIPFVPALISGFLNLYLIMVGSRILGLLFYTQEDKLGWFSRLTPRKA